MLKGECNCGTVQFQIKTRPIGIYLCHCSICRRSTGGNGIAVVVIPNEDFQWASGAENIEKWSKPDSEWETWFCKTCGSRLPVQNDPTRMAVPAGLLDGRTGLKVIHHIWVGSKADWDEIGDSGKQHTEAYRG